MIRSRKAAHDLHILHIISSPLFHLFPVPRWFDARRTHRSRRESPLKVFLLFRSQYRASFGGTWKLLFVYTCDDKTFTEGFMVLESKYLRWTRAFSVESCFSILHCSSRMEFSRQIFPFFASERADPQRDAQTTSRIVRRGIIFSLASSFSQTASFDNGSGTLRDNFLDIKNVKVFFAIATWLCRHSCSNKRRNGIKNVHARQKGKRWSGKVLVERLNIFLLGTLCCRCLIDGHKSSEFWPTCQCFV